MNKKTIFEAMCLNYGNGQTDSADVMVKADNHEEAFSKFVEALSKMGDDIGIYSFIVFEKEKEVHFYDEVSSSECCLFLKQREIVFIEG